MTDISIDAEITALFELITKQKKEIDLVEKPKWETNCLFKFPYKSEISVNIQVVSDISELLKILTFLTLESDTFNRLTKELKLNEKYSYNGFTLHQWKSDIITRIRKINIHKEKTKLSNLETRLNVIVSPEQRRLLEIEAIKKELIKDE